MFKLNDKAPGFILPDVRGKEIALYKILELKHVLLVFYRGGWCPICNMQLGELSEHYKDFEKLNIEILAISNEEIIKGKKLLQKIGSPFYLLQDINSKVIKQYDLEISKRDPLGWILRKQKYAQPATFLINRNGRISWIYKGETYQDRPPVNLVIEAAEELTE